MKYLLLKSNNTCNLMSIIYVKCNVSSYRSIHNVTENIMLLRNGMKI